MMTEENVFGLYNEGTPTDLMERDLGRSGLTPADLDARAMGPSERAAASLPFSALGYIIPYFDLFGRPIAHYRLWTRESGQQRYAQPKDSPTHVYFPRGISKILRADSTAKRRSTIIITDSEKRACLATKLGYATIGLVDAWGWKNRTIELPGDPDLRAKASHGRSKIVATVDEGAEISEDQASGTAQGLQDIVDYALQNDSTFVIAFESNTLLGIKPAIQRGAASLGFELRSKGIPFSHIRQFVIPWENDEVDPNSAIGLDDYLLQEHGHEQFDHLLGKVLSRRTAFPRHPSIQDYVAKRLQKRNISRRETRDVALAIMCDLDATGLRLRSPDEGQTYYFDNKSKVLMKAGFLFGATDEAHDTTFGGLLYRRFGLSAGDQKALVWLSAQFNGELPIQDVKPQRVIALGRHKLTNPVIEDSVCYQINDGQYATVSAQGLEIDDNGSYNVLFEAGHVNPIAANELVNEFRKQYKQYQSQGNASLNWWDRVLADVRLRDHDKAQKLFSLLYYISPWLNRWRGTQLPLEMVIGESGSGKSSLAELRLAILSGDPKLRNSPGDLKDWHASIANTGALHVTDNVVLVNKQLRQQLSDEICRIITEPNPVIEMRRYYTNADVIRLPVRTVFSITAIQQPFQNADILQRSAILKLDKPADPTKEHVVYDMNWAHTKLQVRGGRIAWIAHQLLILHLFFKEVQKSWDPYYRAKHRLVNLEQTLRLMGRVFGMETDWVPDYMVGVQNDYILDADWAFEGIAEFVDGWKKANPKHGINGPYILASDIVDWATGEDEFKDCEVLTNTRKLGRYMQTHKSMMSSLLAMVEAGTTCNRIRYKVLRPEDKARIKEAEKALGMSGISHLARPIAGSTVEQS